ncbi:class I SAM-dependent methyltransferase [Acinetobacter boissieri]|uniref:Methyltransferase domain-containing protein n=1 Tax=Acinetobacter boissieri TaxID=1219383 RepID=A0A1G6GJT5_9GAMM|nr:class I SAM-dependent methyltransferase [Acinetobacter boissieri]SDB81446.1 Methyltransferase domain-containing protein [Acinetobacter boissieri]
MTKALISHVAQHIDYKINHRLDEIKKRIIESTTPCEANNQIELLESLTEFELGQFLIQHEGLNGHWTHELVTWNKNNPKRVLKNNLEHALFEQIPATLATRQRFTIFQKHLLPLITPNKVVASIPSGYMSELLLLENKALKNIQMIGIDLDSNALDGATELAMQCDLKSNLTLIQADAWELSHQEAFDVITSNGLNIYEHDDDRVVQLYKIFYQALKANGTLITSFLTPPPTISPMSPWNMKNIDLESLQLQKLIFVDILKVKWSAYRTVDTTKQQLTSAGFKNIEIVYDDAGMFPTVIAHK